MRQHSPTETGKPHSGGPFVASGATMVVNWNQLMLDMAADARRGPTTSSRLYALVNTALYDGWALLSHTAQPSTATAIGGPVSEWLALVAELSANAGLGEVLTEATMAVAAAEVLKAIGGSLYPGAALPIQWQNQIERLLDRNLNLLDKAEKLTGKDDLDDLAEDLGKWVAEAVLTKALGDRANQQGNYADTTGYQVSASVFDPTQPGSPIDSLWQPLLNNQGLRQQPLTPHWGDVMPFAIGSGASLIPPTLVKPYTSDGILNPQFVAEVNEVLQLSANLTAEQKAIAEYWEAGPGTGFPPGKWMEISNILIGQHDLSLGDAVKLSFSVGQALFDAGIAAWATKYNYNSVRPITSIRQLYNNQTTTSDGFAIRDWRQIPIQGQDWQPYQSAIALSPPFPDVVSGHSAFSAAAASVITNLLGTNVLGTSVTLKDQESRFDPNGFDGIPGFGGSAITLSWPYFTYAAEQAGLSRLYGGIHFRDGNLLGQIVGLQVGSKVANKTQSLFNAFGSPAGAETGAPVQIFGTMDNDEILGLSLGQSPVEIYGFGGNDLLISGGESDHNLFGGFGTDTFAINSIGNTRIMDFQLNESIIFANNLLDISLITTATSWTIGNGIKAPLTTLFVDNTKVATVDGNWSLAQLNLGQSDPGTIS